MLLDISRNINSAMALYPGNPAVEFEVVQKAEGDGSALTRIILGSHTGTHIDAPSHIKAGAQGVDMYPLEQMIGEVQVIDLSDVKNVITAGDILDTTASRVLFKTRNSHQKVDEFDSTFVALDEGAALALVDRDIQVVGIDALSIKKKGVKDRVHEILLQAGIVILEGLWLADVPAGTYELICLPLPVRGLDGVPVRAVLRTI